MTAVSSWSIARLTNRRKSSGVRKRRKEHAVFGAPSRQVQHRIVNDPMPNHSRGRFRQDIFHCPVGATQLPLMYPHLRTRSMRQPGSVIIERTAVGL
jgi:hypothetical protein